ncbi:MAG: 6-carboxytetrahydropterin synthase QueD [Selenomonadaceae bacterium]|nr:6-carboxytetrahydropterin synthase QueD [Selenomonadaceae bacterium]
MFELKVKSEFEAAHYIKNYPGKCARLHGHNWIVEAVVQGENLNELGILVDFKILKDELKKVLDEFDHQYLNELELFANQNPTAEIIAKEIFDKLSTAEIFNGAANLKAVTVYESPKSSVTYFPS